RQGCQTKRDCPAGDEGFEHQAVRPTPDHDDYLETKRVADPMNLSIERICNELNRSGLLPAQDIRNLRGRWLRHAGVSVGDPVLFGKWLAHHNVLTDYQADVLLRRRKD